MESRGSTGRLGVLGERGFSLGCLLVGQIRASKLTPLLVTALGVWILSSGLSGLLWFTIGVSSRVP